MQVIKPRDLVEALRVAILADKPILIQSPPGYGKTEMTHQVVASLVNEGIRGWHDPRLGSCETVDLRGLPVVRDENGTPHTRSALPEDFIPPWENGVLFMDEMGTLMKDMQNVCLPMVQKNSRGLRMCGPHPLPAGTRIVAATNFGIADGTHQNAVSSALADRFPYRFALEADHEDWIDEAIRRGVSPQTIAFISQFPHYLCTDPKDIKRGSWQGHANPRSWMDVDGLMNDAEKYNMKRRHIVLQAAVYNRIGEGIGGEYLLHRAVDCEMPDPDLCIKDWENAPVPNKGKNKYYTTIVTSLAGAIAYRADAKNFATCINYMRRIGDEYAGVMVSMATKKTPELMVTREYCLWSGQGKV